MKTAMQEFFEFLVKMGVVENNIDAIDIFIEKEKEQIINSFNEGWGKGNEKRFYDTGGKYYSETFDK